MNYIQNSKNNIKCVNKINYTFNIRHLKIYQIFILLLACIVYLKFTYYLIVMRIQQLL